MVYYIYSKKNCKYCEKTKDLLQYKKLHYQVIDITDNKDFIEHLKLSNNHNTFPFVFEEKNGVLNFIGGYDNLEKSLTWYHLENF